MGIQLLPTGHSNSQGNKIYSTCSAGRAKKHWGRRWEGVVAMGVAWAGSGVGVVGVKFFTKKTPKG